MKRILITSVIFFFYMSVRAQSVAINTDGSVAHASAILDIKSSNKGLLIPRINLVSDSDITTINSPRLSLLVYNTNGTLDDGEGYYFWNGNKWMKLVTKNNLDHLSWNVDGNTGTNPNQDFIGTTDNKPLIFKTNNILSGKIETVLNNVFFGQSSGLNVTTGNNNSFYGQNSGLTNTTGSGNNFVGYNSGTSNSAGSNNIFVGRAAGKANTIGNKNVAIGDESAFSQLALDKTVAIGSGSLHDNTGGVDNTAIGFEALYKNITGFYNVAIGNHALYNNTTASNNTAMGREALYFNSTGPSNTACGYRSLYSNTTGGSNTALGLQTLYANTTGEDNVAEGFSSMFSNTTGSYNSANGYNALWENASGSYNTAHGYKALYLNTLGNYNTAIGTNALDANTDGDYNTAIGYGSGPQGFVPNLTNTTCIGANAKITTSNTMSFGDGDVTCWVFGRDSRVANAALVVGRDNTDGNGAYLTSGGTWTNTCDANKKENFTDLNATDLLLKISQLNIQRWKYKGTDEYHIGPTAQDFHKLFNVGKDDKGISTVDPSGIALAAIKEQQKLIETLTNTIEKLQQRIETLEKIK